MDGEISLFLESFSFEAVTAWRKERCSCFRGEKNGSCSCVRNGSRFILDRLEWSCQDFRLMQWCFDFVRLEQDDQSARWSFDLSVWSANWLVSVCEVNIDLAIVLFQCVPLLRCWVHTLNPMRVVTTATNQLICHSRVSSPYAARSVCSKKSFYVAF